MKFIRPMIIGMFIGSLGSSLLLNKSLGAAQIETRIKHALGIISCFGQLGRATRRA